MSVEALRKEISTGKHRKYYLFYGPEDYLKRAYLSRLKKLLLNKDYSDLNFIELKGKVDEASLREAVRTFPFFDDHKIIVLTDTGVFKGDSWFTKYFEDLVKNTPPYLIILFYETGEGQINKSYKPYKLVEKNGLVVHFDYQKPRELASWVKNLLAERNVSISLDDSLELVNRCEKRMSEIASETEKLAAWGASKGSVDLEDIKFVSCSSLESTIFEMTDALTAGNAKQALIILERLIAQKEYIPMMIFMIARHFRQLYMIRILHEKGKKHREEIAGMLGLKNPYIAKKLITQALNYSGEKLGKVLSFLREMDVAVKNGNIKDKFAVELIIAAST